jgi:hypothetical protein
VARLQEAATPVQGRLHHLQGGPAGEGAKCLGLLGLARKLLVLALMLLAVVLLLL